MTERTIVVGGGLTGLAAAHALRRAGREVLLLESTARPGGVVRTETRDGYLLERGPNTVRASPELWSLIETLGLAPEVLRADPRSPRYVDFDGALHAVPMSPGGLARTRLLSVSGKLRLLTEPLRPRGREADESVRDFVARRLGPEIADRLVEPFVAGIFAGSAARLSVSAAFPTLAGWEREHGNLLAGALAARKKGKPSPPVPKGLVSFRAGLETLPRALAAALGAGFRPNTDVVSVRPAPGGWMVATPAETFEAERLILAAPAVAAAALVEAFAPDAAAALRAIPHPPLAVLHLAWPLAALPLGLRGFGHLVAPSPHRRILGAVYSSALFPDRAPAGQALLTVFAGGTRDPDAFALADGELVRLAARDLESEGLVRGLPEAILVTRWPRAIPQYERGHSARIAALERAEARSPGLRFAGNYRGGVSVTDVLREGAAAATY